MQPATTDYSAVKDGIKRHFTIVDAAPVERFKLSWLCWDTHHRHYLIMKEHLLPDFDLAYSALMDDLDCRGLLDETLVVVKSDFGRAPQMNGNTAYGPGREHWTYCYSVVLAGISFPVFGSKLNAVVPRTGKKGYGGAQTTIMPIVPEIRARSKR